MSEKMRQMPMYLCHKIVWAVKIREVRVDPETGFFVIVPDDDNYESFPAPDGYNSKHDPQPGGYYVVYSDGYQSYSPAAAFENGYRRYDVNALGIGGALSYLRGGCRVARRNWNGPGQFLGRLPPKENSDMSLPYIYIRTVQGDMVPWLASQTDLLAEDWFVIPESSGADAPDEAKLPAK